MKKYKCSKCKKEIVSNGFSTGYGINQKGQKVCYACCAAEDAEYMKNNNSIDLYLDTEKKIVSNWPGSLKININHIRTGRHNIAGKRYDTWFKFAGKNWHGVQYGDNTQIIHCKVIK